MWIIRNKTPRWKIICLNEVYKFSLGHFSTGCIFYVLILKNTIENQKLHFSIKIVFCHWDIWKKINYFNHVIY